MLNSGGTLKILIVVCSIFSSYGQVEQLSVNTTQGTVSASKVTDRNYFAFYGIPYAGDVSGQNRFKAPPPAPSFPGVFVASDNTVTCAQPTENGLVGVENCLMLNVLTKNIIGPRPVVVFIRGELYTKATYQGLNFQRLVEDENLIVVTLNYRLSIFGFLCLGTPEAPGNAGLKDVVVGLQWVKDNIVAFGGDPGNVMLVGHGSGGAMVDLVSLSPLARGLFHKVIAQSGTSFAPWAVSYNPIEMAHAVGNKLSYTGKSNSELATSFQTTNAEMLVSTINDFPAFTNNTVLFAPCLENRNLPGAFLTESPVEVIKSKNYSHVPFITGYTNREGTLRAQQAVYYGWLEKMNQNFTEFLEVDIDLSRAPNRTAVIESIRKFYFGESIGTINDFLSYHGDTMILVSSIKYAKERASTSTASVRLYEFAFMGSWSDPWLYPTIPLVGARHGHELVYLFGNQLSAIGSNEMNVRTSLTGRWAAFARTGVPQTTVPSGNTEWPAITTVATNALEYSELNEVGLVENAKVNPHLQKMIFWDEIFKNYYVPPQGTSSANAVLNSLIIISICALIVKLF